MIQFLAADGKRKSVRLGKMPMKQAETVKGHVEALVYASIAQTSPANETATWVRNLDVGLAARLAAAGLIAARKTAILGPFITDYIAARTTRLAPNSIINLQWTEKRLVKFF